MRHSSSALELRHARQYLIEHGNTPSGAVSERLARSWARSVAAGLLPVGGVPAAEHASSSQLRQVLAQKDVVDAASALGLEVASSSQRELQDMIRADSDEWRVLENSCGCIRVFVYNQD